MKRHETFIPLSREHYEGLSFAVRLKQGKNSAYPSPWRPDDPRWQAGETVRFFDDHLLAHFRTEEEAIFPVARRCFRTDQLAIILQLLHEHELIGKLVDRLRDPAGEEAELAALLREVGEVLERHIRLEERDFFPMCEEAFPEEDLRRVGLDVGRRYQGGAH